METWLNRITDYLLAQSWQIAVLTIAVALASFLLRNRSAHVRYLLWLVVLAKCLVPPLYSIPLAILPQEKSPALVPVLPPAEALAAEHRPPEAAVAEPVGPASVRTETVPSLVVMERPATYDIRAWLAIGWIAGVVVLSFYYLLNAVRTQIWLQRRRKTLPSESARSIESFFTAHGVSRMPRIWLVERISQPFVWGLVRGSIYLPAKLLDGRHAKFQASLLGHELSHVIRFDAAVNSLQVIAQTVFWFHPLVSWANRKIRVERELCCDEMTIARLNESPEEYGEAIVETLAAKHEQARPVPSLAVAGQIKNIEERIRSMLKPGKKFYKRPSLVALTVALLFAACAVPTTLVLTARAETEPEVKSLHEAASEGDIEQVRVLLAKGADVEAKTGWANWLPLHVAARYGHRDICEALIRKGANVHAKARHDATALLYAACGGHKDVAELLVENGADINEKSGWYGTPLCAAAIGGREDMMDWLLAKGADPNAALFCAATIGHSDAAKLLLAKGADANAKGDQSWTPLHEAVSYCRKNVAEVLIANGANVNAKDDSGIVPARVAFMMPMFWAQQQIVETVHLLLANGAGVDIHLAAFSGDLSRVKSFLEEGVDINAKIEFTGGRRKTVLTPICMAIIAGQKKVVRFLVLEGADVKSSSTPLNFALTFPDYEVVKLLIDNGADVNAQGFFQTTPLWTPLDAAVSRRAGFFERAEPYLDIDTTFPESNPGVDSYEKAVVETITHDWPRVRDIIELLLKQGADIDGMGWGDQTLLIRVASYGLKDAVELLLGHGADINAKSRGGRTALHAACRGNHKDVVELLLAKGADMKIQDQDNKTPLAIAEEEGHTEIVELLKEHGAKE